MRVRRAAPEDVPGFARVVADVAAEGRHLLTEAPVDLEDFERRLTATLREGEDLLFVLEDEGTIVGSLGLHSTSAPGVRSLGMAILTERRGAGGGRLLLEAALAAVENETDAHKVELEAYPWNARAIALYARSGFQVEGLRRAHYRRRDGSLWPVVVMARLIGPARAE